jgi:TrmH family RNA methyltransferase
MRRDARSAVGQFLAEGANAAREAVSAHKAGNVAVRELVITAEARQRHSDLVAMAERAEIEVTPASEPVIKALSETVTPQGIVVVVEALDVSLGELFAATPALLAILADVRDPGNAGSVIRAADAAGADGVIFAGDSVDPYNGKVVRSSVGGLFHLPVVRADQTTPSVSAAMTAARSARLRVVVADGSGRDALDDQAVQEHLVHPTAWVFGNEAWGVPDAILDAADAVVRIPIYGRAESLNVGMAAALCLYASARAQRS